MGRKRKRDTDLPGRVYRHGKQFRYHPKSGKPIVLGPTSDYPGMLRKLSELVGHDYSYQRMSDVFMRYLAEITPTKAETTHANETDRIARLNKWCGHMPPQALKPHHAAKYRDLRAKKQKVDGRWIGGPVAAKHEMQLLKHVMAMAKEWGAIKENVLHDLKPGVRGHKAKRPYTSTEVYEKVLPLAPPMFRAFLHTCFLTGLRRKDVAELTRDNITDEGIVVRPSKTEETTGVEILFEWTPELRETINAALRLPPRVRRFVFCNRKGEQFQKKALDSALQRLHRKAAKELGEGYRFDIRSLRRKNASDSESLEEASDRLGHASQEITERVYRVRRTVRPLK